MAYLATTAADRFALFNAIASFAGTLGWTVNWNVTTNNGQLGLSKGNTLVAIGARQTTPVVVRQMLAQGGTINDVPLLGTLATAFSGTQAVWGGHTGAPGGSTSTSHSHVWFNDFYGPFTNVFLFSNANGDYIHVVAQTGSRYSMFSFGLLDNAGMTTNRSSYLTGTWFEFWENSANPATTGNTGYQANKPGSSGAWQPSSTSISVSGGHFFLFGGRSYGNESTVNSHCRPAPGVVDAAIFPSIASVVNGCRHSITHTNSWGDVDTFVRYMHPSMFGALPTSIGLPLMDMPYIAPFTGPNMFFGNYPDVRSVWIDNVAPGEELNVNGDIWKVFPVKQKGTLAAVNAEIGINSWSYGYAFRKIT